MIGQLQKKLSFLLSAVSICFLLLILLFLFFYNRNSLYMGMKNALTNAMAQPLNVPTSGSYPIFQLVIREDGEIEESIGQDYFLDADIKEKLIQKALKQVKSEKGSFFSSVKGGSFPYYCKRSTEPQEEREESPKDSVGEGKDRDFSKEEAKEEARYRLVITDFRKESTSIRRLLGVLGMLFVVLSGGIALFARFFVGKTLIPVKESLEAQRQFVADASHELKTPLTVILNDVENLDYHLNRFRKEEKEKTDPSDLMEWTELQKMEGAVRGIQEMSRRMKYLTESLLDLSRLERWQDRKNQFAILSFTHLVEMECLLFEPLFFDQKRTLTYHLEENLNLRGEANKLKQLISILLENALKYSPLQTETEVSMEKRGKDIRLQISNATENEFRKEELEKLWRRFFRMEESRTDGGYGLGLSIAKEIVKIHQGEISAEGSGKRITFTVWLSSVR